MGHRERAARPTAQAPAARVVSPNLTKFIDRLPIPRVIDLTAVHSLDGGPQRPNHPSTRTRAHHQPTSKEHRPQPRRFREIGNRRLSASPQRVPPRHGPRLPIPGRVVLVVTRH
jgi:hypothetical protein